MFGSVNSERLKTFVYFFPPVLISMSDVGLSGYGSGSRAFHSWFPRSEVRVSVP